jgi:hypothetical protein
MQSQSSALSRSRRIHRRLPPRRQLLGRHGRDGHADGGLRPCDMNSAAVILLPKRQQRALNPREAAFAASSPQRSVGIDSDEAGVRLRRRFTPAELTVLTRPRRTTGGLDVPCPAFYDRLSRAARVTQLSAAADSGKTVLLRSWIDHADLATRVAWVPVEHDERDTRSVTAAVLAPSYILVRLPRRRRIGQPEPRVPVHRVRERYVVGAGSASHA